MSDITVVEAQAKVGELRKRIADALSAFEAETGLKVNDISSVRREHYTQSDDDVFKADCVYYAVDVKIVL